MYVPTYIRGSEYVMDEVVKKKLSLWLTKYPAMKTYPVLN